MTNRDCGHGPVMETLESRRLFSGTPVVEEAVRALFRDMLHRDPEPAALAAFEAELTDRMSVGVVARQIADTPEFLGDQVEYVFERFLHRASSPADRAFFSNVFHGGTTLTLSVYLADSPEYISRAGGNNTTLVNNLYQDFYNRAPNAAEATALLHQLSTGFPASSLGWQFAYQREAVDLVTENLYQNLLGRSADAAAKTWVYNGLTGYQPLQNFVGWIVGSQEYAHNRIDPRGSPNEVWFRQMIQDFLQRPATQAEVDTYLPKLDNAFPRADTVLAFLFTDEYNRTRVVAVFREFLHRDPEATAISTFATLMDQGTSEREIIQTVISTPEYFNNRGGGTAAGYVAALSNDLFGNATGLQAALPHETGQVLATNDPWWRGWLAYRAVNQEGFYDHRVAAYFQTFLHRPASAGDSAYFGHLLYNKEFDLREMIQFLLMSDEYYRSV